MEKLNNVSSCTSSEFLSSYEEVASFSEEDIENLVNYEVRGDGGCNNHHQSLYNLRIKLYGNGNQSCGCNCIGNGISNKMLLDNLGDKYISNGSCAKFGCMDFYTNFNSNGICMEIYSDSSDKTFQVGMRKSKGDITKSSCQYSYGEGFSLSEVMDNVGDIDDLVLSNSGCMASITINQRVCVVSKCGKPYVIFKFTLKNNGEGTAQKILFKNKFNRNILIDGCNVFLNGCKVKEDDIFLNRNVMKIKIPDMKCGEEVCLIVVGGVFNGFPREYSYGIISYVSEVSKKKGETTLDISQKMSNIKIV